MQTRWPGITYMQAEAAHEAWRKIHCGSPVWLVRCALRVVGQPLIYRISDERTGGDPGFLLYPDGLMESK